MLRWKIHRFRREKSNFVNDSLSTSALVTNAGEGAVSVMVGSVLNMTLKIPAAANIWLHGNGKNTSVLTLRLELEQERGDSESETYDPLFHRKRRDKNEMNESLLGVKSWLIGCCTLVLLTCYIFNWFAGALVGSLIFGIKTKWTFCMVILFFF